MGEQWDNVHSTIPPVLHDSCLYASDLPFVSNNTGQSNFFTTHEDTGKLPDIYTFCQRPWNPTCHSSTEEFHSWSRLATIQNENNIAPTAKEFKIFLRLKLYLSRKKGFMYAPCCFHVYSVWQLICSIVNAWTCASKMRPLFSLREAWNRPKTQPKYIDILDDQA